MAGGGRRTLNADRIGVLLSGSSDAWVMLTPRSAYRTLTRQPTTTGGIWLAVRRHLFLAFLLGCTISLITSEGLSWRLAGSAAIYWSFVPLVEAGALIALAGRNRTGLSLPRMIDLFFSGHGPWSLWLIGLSAIWSFFPPARAYALTSPAWLIGGGLVAIAWSAWISVFFDACSKGPGKARATAYSCSA